MASSYSTEAILKQIGSGILSGGVIGILLGRGQHLIGYFVFTSMGLMDLAYHFHYSKAHITHLTFDQLATSREIRTRVTHFQRTVQRELRDSPDDFNQELRWFWNDVRRYIDEHIYYGMGFGMAFLLSIVLVPKAHR